jgi:predicted O-methyltransferase YrrM
VDQLVRDFIVPTALKRGWKSFCEIGASEGLSTDQLLKIPDISHTIIDPGLDADLVAKYAGDRRVTVLRDLSLAALAEMDGLYDCFLIDGDHNWYTVFNELTLIRKRELLRPGGTIFFHDVEWPYGRRDMYYQPETIPREYRLAFERKGILRGQRALADSGGTNPQFCNAIRVGGPQNGVLTAIEDFIAEHPSEYQFCRIRFQGDGLGILQFRSSDPAGDGAFLSMRIAAGWQDLCAFPRSALRYVLWKAFPGFMQKRYP